MRVAGVPGTTTPLYSFQVLAQPPVVTSVVPLSGPVMATNTTVVITGSFFTTDATVYFVELNATGQVTGQRRECVWRDVPGMGCSDGLIR